jgi:hypothetical protein
VVATAALQAVCAAAAAAPSAALLFDDFSYADAAALTAGGWQVRTQAGHPGVPGAGWGAEAVSLLDDSEHRGNRLLRLSSRTDGTPAGTQQAQLCHARKYLHGTYAARLRFSDAPAEGPDGDVVVQTFYAVSPLRFDFDPDYSEVDWEYLPNGGWGDERQRLYAVSWQTARLEPWSAHNEPHQRFGSAAGWHVLVMQVDTAQVRWFLDGRPLAVHGGRNVPVVPMAIQFSQWFAPGALKPEATPRRWQLDVDWVLHAAGVQWSPQRVLSEVQSLRRAGVARRDGVPASDPPLPSTCDF